MKIKLIDLLNKIANGEDVPKKVNYCWTDFYYDENGKDYLSIANQFNNGGISIFKYIFSEKLNDEVEIIEDKKIEKIDKYLIPQNYVIENENAPMKKRMELVRELINNNSIEINIVKDKINELIDAVNDLKGGDNDESKN